MTKKPEPKRESPKQPEDEFGVTAIPADQLGDQGSALVGDEVVLPPVPMHIGVLDDPALVPVNAGMPPRCSWPLDRVEGRARLHQCLEGQCESLWLLTARGPHELHVTDVACVFGSYTPEESDGEVREGPRWFLLGDGHIYTTSSSGIYRSLQHLSWLEGPPPWIPPCILIAARVATNRNRDRLSVTLIRRGDANGAAKGGGE